MKKWLFLLVSVLMAGCSLPWFGGKLPLKESQVWKRAELGPDNQATAPGIYFRDIKSGQTEAWQLAQDGVSTVTLSADVPADGLALVATSDAAYLINRSAGKTYQWDPKALSLVAASPSNILFREAESGQFRVTAWNLKAVASFKLPDGKALGVIAPDGKTAAVATNPTLHMVNLADGTVTLAADPPSDALAVQVVSTIRDGAEIIFGYTGSNGTVLRRYGWDGKLLGQLAVVGPACAFTADGSRVACTGGQEPATTVVYDVAAGEALYRVLGADTPAWAADGSLVVHRSNLEGARVVTAEGKVTETGATRLVGFLDRLTPAPDNPDRFALRDRVVDADGELQFMVENEPKGWEYGWTDPWGKAGTEFRYVLKEPRPMGFEQLIDLPLEPKVQKAPFPAEIRLQIVAVPGDCLNLRTDAGTTAKIIRCLPGGTKLTRAPGDRVSKDGHDWLPVKTTDGVQGWVAVTTGNLGYAD
ncbi:MAG TPA: SH3 domain-containing protein [Symbiobacteriaceae bacterium]|nr:SH3 domain-containing protein [Symbiobacteriaceae bacterium]